MNGQIAVCCCVPAGWGGGGGWGMCGDGMPLYICIVVALNVDARQIVP